MKTRKTAILLMNIGSPDRPRLFAVWKYLTLFLNDKHVIDLPWLLRKFLVNLVIIPFRVWHSTGLYQRLWTEKGSPLIYYSLEMKEKLQAMLGNNFKVFIGMRYGNPGLKDAIGKIEDEDCENLHVIPLFPQYAMSTTGTAVEAVKKEIKKRKMNLRVIEIKQFYDHPKFIKAFSEQIQKYDRNKYDHIVFSYHGLPNRQLERCHPGIKPTDCLCQDSIPEYGRYCYRASCYATARYLALELGYKKDNYSVAFQSRLSRNWMRPFTDEVLIAKLKEGKKRILVVAPSFVTDCLETIIEIGENYRKMFLEKGGEDLQLVESLNVETLWIEALENIVRDSTEHTT